VGRERGDVRWAHETDGKIWSSATVSADLLVFGSHDGRIYAHRNG